jgi:hypothetical protein
MNPIARMNGLDVKRLGNEVVVFDPEKGNVHHLNQVADVVWRACDGQTDIDGLSRIVGRVTNTVDARPAVELALEQLSSRGLLETQVARPDPDQRRNRRDALKVLAKAMAIPIVLTITASKARAYYYSGAPCTIVCPVGSLNPTEPGVIIDGVCYPIYQPCIAVVVVV